MKLGNLEKTTLRGIAMAMALCLAPAALHATDRTWDGSQNANWNDKKNWTPEAAPSNTDNTIFGVKNAIQNPTMNATGNVLGVIFTGTGGWTIGGASLLTIGATGIDNTGSGNNTISAPVSVGASTWSVNSGTITLSGNVQGSGNIVKDGAGSVVTSGTVSWSGQLSITAGTFFINGNKTGTGKVSVTSTGILAGTGTLASPVDIGSGGTLAVGQSPGIMTFSSSLSFSDANSKVVMDISGTTRGSTYDGANIAGALTYGGDLTLNISGVIANGTYDLFQFGSQNGSFDTILLAGSYSGGLINNGSGVWSGGNGGKFFTFTQSTGDLVVVPEPAMLGLLGAGLGFAFWRVRRRPDSDQA